MKKMLVVIFAVMMLSVNAFSYVGTVNVIYTDSAGLVKVSFTKPDNTISGGWQLVGTADAVKAMLAVVLTAKTTGADVEYLIGTVNGVKGWIQINMQ